MVAAELALIPSTTILRFLPGGMVGIELWPAPTASVLVIAVISAPVTVILSEPTLPCGLSSGLFPLVQDLVTSLTLMATFGSAQPATATARPAERTIPRITDSR